MKILVIHGPNLNMLGYRNKEHYGSLSFTALEKHIENVIKVHDDATLITFFQSNSEGALIDRIHQSIFDETTAIVLNLGAYSHYSIALRDALEISRAIKVEVHLSAVETRDDFRRKLLTGEVCDNIFSGKHEQSYTEAIDWLFDEKIKRSI